MFSRVIYQAVFAIFAHDSINLATAFKMPMVVPGAGFCAIPDPISPVMVGRTRPRAPAHTQPWGDACASDVKHQDHQFAIGFLKVFRTV